MQRHSLQKLCHFVSIPGDSIVAQLSRQKSKIFIRELRESSGTLPCPIYAKLHMATALPDSSIQPVSDSQVQNDAAQSCKCGYTVR